MRVLFQARWCVVLLALIAALGWTVRALPAPDARGGSLSLAEGDGDEGDSGAGVDFA